MVAAPQLGNGAWELSKVFMDKLSYLLNKVNKKRQQLSAKITCQLAITEYGGSKNYQYYKVIIIANKRNFSDKFDVEACQDLNENKVNLNFTLDIDDG